MQTPANTQKLPFNQRAPRLWGWALITIVLVVAVWGLAPQQLPVSLYKLSLVTLAAVVGYWLDRSLFPYARPDKFEFEHATLFGLTMVRRALVVGCAMLAMGLGA
jgi:Putative 2/3 transmembrane domain holin